MDRKNLTIRSAAEGDASRLAAIHIAAWRATYRGVMSDEYLDGLDIERYTNGWLRNIRTPREGTVHLVVQVGDEVVGFASLGPSIDSPDSAAGQLYAINLHPDCWANGIGTVLFGAAEETLIALGYDKGFLWVEATNDRAISFYQKLGWLNDGGTMEDTRFDPPIVERRHSREFEEMITQPVMRGKAETPDETTSRPVDDAAR